MIRLIIFLMGALLQKLTFKSGSQGLNKAVPASFFDFKINDITGKEFSFDKLRGKKLIMVVNVACSCGLTSDNYAEMVKAYNRWQSKGFQILAFPCNQFFGQESGTPEEIVAFAKNNFNANFPIMEKIEVNGENTHPIFVYLRNNSSLYDPVTKTAKVIPWNFAKFFIDSNGKVINFLAPNVKSEEVTAYIQKIIEG